MTTVNLNYRHRELLMRFVVMTATDIDMAKRIAGLLLDVPFTNADDVAPITFTAADLHEITDAVLDDDVDDLIDRLTDQEVHDYLELMELTAAAYQRSKAA